MKTCGDSGGIASQFLPSALDGGEWSVSRPGRFTPWERAAGTHLTGDSVGLRAGLDTVEKRRILILAGIERRPSSPKPVEHQISHSVKGRVDMHLLQTIHHNGGGGAVCYKPKCRGLDSR
jgi:hypothetical protein